MGPSTAVTKKLCAQVQEDTMKGITDFLLFLQSMIYVKIFNKKVKAYTIIH